MCEAAPVKSDSWANSVLKAQDRLSHNPSMAKKPSKKPSKKSDDKRVKNKPYLREGFHKKFGDEWHPVGEMTDAKFEKGIEEGTILHGSDFSQEALALTRKRTAKRKTTP